MEIEAASSSYSAKSSSISISTKDGDGGSSSMYQEKVASEGGAERGVYLVWEDLTVVLPNFGNGPTRRLLQGLRGFAEPGRIMAIMGPSGSGKSTLLDSLAEYSDHNLVMFDRIYNTKKEEEEEEAALLKRTVFPSFVSGYRDNNFQPCGSEIVDLYNLLLIAFIIDLATGRLSRNVLMTGSVLFNGKKRRLDAGVAYVTQEDVLLGTLTVRETITYSANLRLPNTMRKEEIDCVVEGTIMEMGLQDCADRMFFAEAGFPCPRRRNPSDHFLRCINSDFDAITATLKGSQKIQDVPISADPLMSFATEEIKSRLVEKYRRSNYAQKAKARVKEISAIEGLEVETQSGSEASWRKQLSTLTRRSFVNMSRDVGYYWARIVIYIVVSICVGTIYHDVGYDYTAILARVACGGFITGFMTFMSIGGFPSFIEEMKVFYREKLNGYYGVTVFILSNYISSFPFLVTIALLTGTICFYLVKFRSGFNHYVFFCLNIFGAISVIESLMMVVASLVPNFLTGLITGAGIIGIMMMTSGFFRLLPDLPKPFWRYPVSYINFGAWGIQGAYKNDFIGLEFEPLVPGEPKISGEFVVTRMFGVPLDHSKWWDLSAIYLILVCYRILFFVVLKLKERALPFVKDLYSKRTLRIIEKRPSFRKAPSFSSSRHQPLHSLSSQEGLNSPLN
ncbi:hypothetical protein H0E87_001588 [Populus deltoides]|uniref:ABC transporter domain-containing protein n=1 Tax=Populus deltoides TaxID=3696 RepID=A0A8T2ZRZ2_POPDE|nr:hypothetical protein H0E87_001588 [Populus deltoides]